MAGATGFDSNLTDQPYWLDGMPVALQTATDPLDSADVVVIGSGYTGLHAAIETARGGRSTMVLDA